jgi:hypothetical protein
LSFRAGKLAKIYLYFGSTADMREVNLDAADLLVS